MKNLNERKQFWQSQNPSYVRSEKASNLKKEAHAKFPSCNHYQSCSQVNQTTRFGPNTSSAMNRKSSFGPNSYYTKNQKSCFDPNASAQNQTLGFGPKSHSPHSQPKSNSVKDIKGKGKLVLDSKVQNTKKSANPRTSKKTSIVKPSNNNTHQLKKVENKIKVYTIKPKEETTLLKRTYMVDLSVAIPYSVKDSPGPKRLWVPKSA